MSDINDIASQLRGLQVLIRILRVVEVREQLVRQKDASAKLPVRE